VIPKKKKQKRPELPFEPIFGFTGEDPTDVKPTRQKKKIVVDPFKNKRKEVQLQIEPFANFEATMKALPDAAVNLDPTKILNMVNVPEALLRQMHGIASRRASAYARFLFLDVMPSVSALRAGNKFFQAAILDSTGEAMDMGDEVAEVGIEAMVTLDVLTFFLRRLKAPLKYERMYLKRVTELMAEHTVLKMDAMQKLLEKHHRSEENELVGIVARTGSKRTNDKIQELLKGHAEQVEQQRQAGHHTTPGSGTVKRRPK